MFLNKLGMPEKQEEEQDQNEIHLNKNMITLSGKVARYRIFVNVGGDMESYHGEDERIAFGTVAKGQKKYGSTSRFRRNDQTTMVYNVQKGDTMQGIAVKFGITTEQIRRTNQMWTNDSLFLRDKLLIPYVGEVKNIQEQSNSSLVSDSENEVESSQVSTASISSSQQEETTAV